MIEQAGQRAQPPCVFCECVFAVVKSLRCCRQNWHGMAWVTLCVCYVYITHGLDHSVMLLVLFLASTVILPPTINLTASQIPFMLPIKPTFWIRSYQYDVMQPQSDYSISRGNGVWCTSWDAAKIGWGFCGALYVHPQKRSAELLAIKDGVMREAEISRCALSRVDHNC